MRYSPAAVEGRSALSRAPQSRDRGRCGQRALRPRRVRVPRCGQRGEAPAAAGRKPVGRRGACVPSRRTRSRSRWRRSTRRRLRCDRAPPRPAAARWRAPAWRRSLRRNGGRNCAGSCPPARRGARPSRDRRAAREPSRAEGRTARRAAPSREGRRIATGRPAADDRPRAAGPSAARPPLRDRRRSAPTRDRFQP